DAADPGRQALREAADHLAHGQGDERRPREEHRIGGIRLHHEARRDRPAPLADAGLALPVGAATEGTRHGPAADQLELETLERRWLLEGVYRHYGYDFREYALASLRRRVWRRVHDEGLGSITPLTDRLLPDPAFMGGRPRA